MEDILMKCGHTAMAHEAGTNKPYCVICDCSEVAEEKPSLEGRIAKCSYCSNTQPSKYSLPFFEYTPERPMDKYYCGCFGWD